MLNYENISISEATSLQEQLRTKLLLTDGFGKITTIAGADISHNKYSDVVYAGIVVLSYPQLEVIGYSLVECTTQFKYIPGYLGFREVPALLAAWQQLPAKPDITVLDGQGITHPRRMGIASHFGVVTDSPTIGCAKNMLFGKYGLLPTEKGSSSGIYNRDEPLGYALRTKKDVKPVFISPGHKVSVPSSLAIVKNCIRNHRIPEPTRQAHEYVNRFRTGSLTSGYHTLNVQGNLFD